MRKPPKPLKTIANIAVGKPDIDPKKESHVKGIHEGNSVGNMDQDDGLEPDGSFARGNARRSTGINAKNHEPIDPRMPKLQPS